ncbi:MAG: hypothetical protein C4536_05065 [Actinobacteria bacterium]|jgi:hypothetical protein|nr:MAG: hypothetical protein C4536_05065 [Actinomycetota bacterium]
MDEMKESYEREELDAVFTELLPYYRAAAAKALGGESVDRVLSRASADFAALVPDIPFVGSLQYPLARDLIESAVALSFYRALKDLGMTTGDAGQVILDAADIACRAVPQEIQIAQGEQQFTPEWYGVQEVVSRESHKRLYPGDWVFDFVAGEPGSFDWGWDFTECGICKFFEKQGAAELIPYMCEQDFIISEYQGTGLVRTTTLAEGAERCDFRYKKGRRVR